MKLPLISVVLSAFNGEKFIRQQIDSILAQTYPNLEIILSDDGSFDNTKAILSVYQVYQNIRIIFREKNLGFSQNFYQSALHASGEYIAFADQDDIWLPHKIFTLYNSISDRYLVFSNSELIDEAGNLIEKKLSDLRSMHDVSNTKGFFLENLAWGHSILIKKTLLNYYGILPANVEYDKWLAVLATCLSGIKYVSEPLALYRQHTETVTEKFNRNILLLKNAEDRYSIYLKRLKWLEVLKNNSLEKEKLFYERFYKFFIQVEKGSFAWGLFFFMIYHEKDFFSFKQKNLISNLFEIRKIARGIKMPADYAFDNSTTNY